MWGGSVGGRCEGVRREAPSLSPAAAGEASGPARSLFPLRPARRGIPGGLSFPPAAGGGCLFRPGGGGGRLSALEGGAAGGRGGAVAVRRCWAACAGRGSPAARSARSGRAWGSCCRRRRSARAPRLRRRLLSRPEARSHSWIPAGKGPWAASPGRGGCEAAGARSGSREAAGRPASQPAPGGAAAGRGVPLPAGGGHARSASASVTWGCPFRRPRPRRGGGWMRHGHAGVPGAAAG